MKKFLFVFLVLVMVVCCFVSCDKNDDKTNDTTQKSEVNVETSSRLILMSVTKDIYGNTIKEMFEDKYSHKMYIWEYEYTNHYGEFVLTNSWMTVIDAEGNEVPDEPQVSVNGCTCTGNSGDVYNDYYYGYKLECTCNCSSNKNEETSDEDTSKVPQSTKFTPYNLIDNEYVTVTIIDCITDEYSELKYKLKVVNKTDNLINVFVEVIELNDIYLNDSSIYTVVEVGAGKTAYDTIEFYSYVLTENYITNIEKGVINVRGYYDETYDNPFVDINKTVDFVEKN